MLDNAPSMLSRKAKLIEPSEIPDEQTVIGESDMSRVMQAHALRIASEALDLHSVTDFKEIAGYIKKVRTKSQCYLRLQLLHILRCKIAALRFHL